MDAISSAIGELLAQGHRLARRPRATLGAHYQIRAQADVVDVDVYGDIGGGFLSEGIEAQQFRAALRDLQNAPLRVHINSPGGDLFDGLAIYNTLRMYPGPVETVVEGLAASAASIVALAGRPATMAKASLLMIHDPWGVAMGTAKDMLDMSVVLEQAGEILAEIYVDKSGASRKSVREWMAAETWFSAEQAVEDGLVDRLVVEASPAALAARASFDCSHYRNTPRTLRPPVAVLDDDAEQRDTLARQRDWLRHRRATLAGIAA